MGEELNGWGVISISFIIVTPPNTWLEVRKERERGGARRGKGASHVRVGSTGGGDRPSFVGVLATVRRVLSSFCYLRVSVWSDFLYKESVFVFGI